MSEKNEFVYIKIADAIEQQILNNTLRTGDKLPSLRMLCDQYGVSQNTALSAYYRLESKMLIETRPQSGYYVQYTPSRIPRVPEMSRPSAIASFGLNELLVSQVYDNLGEGASLALATPANELLPVARLNKALLLATRELNGSGVAYDKAEGNERLRRQIARWALPMRPDLSHHDVITTSGCLNALSYCLMAVTERGDTVAMESPVSFGMLQLAEALGLKVLELPTHPDSGVDLNAFEAALKNGSVRASLLMSNFSNPLGSCMPDENKKAAVALSCQYNVPLIENDVSADIYFGPTRPRSCKSYDESGIVLWCGSVSKTLAPGYRVGWVAPGRFKENVLRMKLYHQISGTAVTQEAIGSFLETGRYERHLKQLRHILNGNMNRYSRAISDYFPEGTRASRPQGGSVLWVELPGEIDTAVLHRKALARNISFAPGRIFTLQNQYQSCMRLNYGLIWSEQTESQLKTLGELACAF
ncbi:MAG: PLP-dependent aminotransferase family protein [Dyadobacter fermentans]